MIEVFQTNVQHRPEAEELVQLLRQHFPASRINFDLEDCDRILRLEGRDFDSEKVVTLMQEQGYHCAVLE